MAQYSDLDNECLSSYDFASPYAFLAQAEAVATAATGLTRQVSRWVAGLATGLDALRGDVDAWMERVGTVGREETAEDRARTVVRMSPQWQRILRSARAVPGLAEALEAELVDLGRATIDGDVRFVSRPDVRGALAATSENINSVRRFRDLMESRLPEQARNTGREIDAVRTMARHAHDQLAQLEDDPVAFDFESARQRRDAVVELRRMIKHYVTEGDLFSLARPHGLLQLGGAWPAFGFAGDRPDPRCRHPLHPFADDGGEQTRYVRGVREALLQIPDDAAARQNVFHHRIMGVVWATVHNRILSRHDVDADAGVTDETARAVEAFLAPLTSPYVSTQESAAKVDHVRLLCRRALELRVRLTAASDAHAVFLFSGPGTGESFFSHADRVSAAYFENVAGAPPNGGLDGRIVFTEFGGLARVVTTRPRRGAVSQVRVVWETRPIVVVGMW